MERTRLIPASRTIIPALDVDDLGHLAAIVAAVDDIELVGGYKIPGYLGLNFSLPVVVDAIREISVKPVILDYQKAGNDIPDIGAKFAKSASLAGVDAVILFPFAGPKTQEDWTKACQHLGLLVIIGAEMTHPGFARSSGGCIADEAFDEMFWRAYEQGVRDFVIPGNKLPRVEHYIHMFESWAGVGGTDCYSPGLVTQGGQISDTGKEAGKHWHAIVGRGIYESADPRAAAELLVTELQS